MARIYDKMLTFEKYFEIRYDQDGEAEESAKEISEALRKNAKRIMKFFRLEKFEKITVVIYSKTDSYAAHLEQCGQSYREWMIADTFDGKINALTLETCRGVSSHAQMSKQEYARLIIHEFTHICQQQVEPNCYGVIWFWEALAVNLAGQVMPGAEINCDPEELMFHYNELPTAYAVSYRLGKYMLERLPYEQIYNYIRNPAALRKDTAKILRQAKTT